MTKTKKALLAMSAGSLILGSGALFWLSLDNQSSMLSLIEPINMQLQQGMNTLMSQSWLLPVIAAAMLALGVVLAFKLRHSMKNDSSEQSYAEKFSSYRNKSSSYREPSSYQDAPPHYSTVTNDCGNECGRGDYV